MNRLLAVLLLTLASCQASPLVAYSVFDGQGAVYTDSNALVAFGQLDGEAGAFMKGTGLPVTIPVSVDAGEVYLFNAALGIDETRLVGDPLPFWVMEIIPTVHLAAINESLGTTLLFGQE